jgi:hypothetical protein
LPASELTLWSRRGCHLCELMIEELIPLCRGQVRLTVLDVDTQADWRERYGLRVPVLCIGEREICAVRLDRAAVLKVLAESA